MENENIKEESSKRIIGPKRWLPPAFVFLFCTTTISSVYLLRERRNAVELAERNEAMTDQLSQTRTQLQALTARLNNGMSSAATAPARVSPPLPIKARRTFAAGTVTKSRPRKEDPRWKQIQSELSEQKERLAATEHELERTRASLHGDLSSARDVLSGSIARTHEELVSLEKRGQRNYYEFELGRSKDFRRVGPIALSLRKANMKRQYCDLELRVDDFRLTKKHLNLYEPVLMYPADYGQPLELVINRIQKGGPRGYVSEPKYKANELALGSTAPAPAQEPAAKLEHRQEPEH